MTSSEFSFQVLPSNFINCCFRYSSVHLIFNFIYLFLTVLGLVFVAVRIFHQLQQAGATLQLWCMGFSLPIAMAFSCCRAQPLGTQGSAVPAPELQNTGSVVVPYRLSCSIPACGIFPDQGSDLCLLHWQADSLSLSYQSSPVPCILKFSLFSFLLTSFPPFLLHLHNIFINLCVCAQLLSHEPARLLCPLGFSRQEYWSGLPCPLAGDLPDPGIEPGTPALQADSLPTELSGKPLHIFSV